MRTLLLSGASVALLSLGALALTPATAQQVDPSNQPTIAEPATGVEATGPLHPVPAAEPAEEAEAAESELQPTGRLQTEAIQPPETIMLEAVLDADVLDVTGEDVAWVEEVLVSTDGALTHLVIGHGGFLGIGSKSILVPWNSVAYDAATETIRIPGNEADLEAAPEFVSREYYENEQAAEREQLGAVPQQGSGVPQQTE